MIVSDAGQARVFLINIGFGILCMVLFDFFVALTRHCGKTKMRVNILDAIYFFAAFAVMLYAQVRYNLGALRYYQIIALLMGIFLYRRLFSRLVVKLFDRGVYFFKMNYEKILRIVFMPLIFVLNIIFTAIEFIEGKILKASHKINKKVKKVKIKQKKKKKTAKKRLKMI